jgi:hypothetical protein
MKMPLAAAALEQLVDRLLHAIDLLFDHAVLVGGVALEAQRRAEMDAVLHRQRQQAERTEPREGRSDRERGHAEQTAQAGEVGEAGLLLLRADDPDRHDRGARLEREPQEAVAEALQAIALRVELVHAADAFREHRDALAVLEHVDAVGGRADQRADARRRDAHPGKVRDPVLAHRARDARRIGLEQQRDAEHRRVEWQLSRVVGDDQHAPRRQVLDA